MPRLAVNLPMLTDEEKRFVQYWKDNRNRQRKFLKQLALGLPAGVLFAAAVFINFISGWDKKATEVFRSYPSVKSLILVLLLAILGIVIFVSVFSVKVTWDRNEQRYRELLSRSDSPSASS